MNNGALEWHGPTARKRFCRSRQRHHQSDTVFGPFDSRRCSLLSASWRRSTSRPPMRATQPRLQVRQHPPEWPGSNASPAHHLPMKTPVSNSTDGSSLIVVLSVIATLAVGVVVALDYTSAVRHHVRRSDVFQNRNYKLATAFVEHEFSYWREVCQITQMLPQIRAHFSTIPLPTQSQFPGISNFSAQRTPADLTQPQVPTVEQFPGDRGRSPDETYCQRCAAGSAVGMSPTTTQPWPISGRRT